MDYLQGILTVTRHGDAGDDLTLTVEFSDAAPLIRNQFNSCNISHQHWRSLVGLDDKILDIRNAAQVATSPNHVFSFGHFDHTATNISVGFAHHLRHFGQRNAVGAEFYRVDSDLVSLDKPTDGSHFGDPMCFCELIPQVPVLQGAQFSQGFVLGQHGILVNPAHPGCIRTDLWRHPLGHATGREVQILQYP